MGFHSEQITFFVIFCLVFCEIFAVKSEIMSGNNSCSLLGIGARLLPVKQGNVKNGGLLEIKPPSSSSNFTVCYPSIRENSSLVGQTATFVHVFCRQLGYTTYATYSPRHEKKEMALYIESDKVACLGHEQDLGHCKWCGNHFENCYSLLFVECSVGYKTVEAREGTISSPGYPDSYFYTIFFEWSITVPKGHGIKIVFNKFVLPLGSPHNSDCVGYPFVEILYGPKDSPKVHKNCAGRYENILNVPDNTAKVRFYSGIHSSTRTFDVVTKYGFQLTFHTIENESAGTRFLVYSCSALLVLGWLIALVCYLCPKWSFRGIFRRTSTQDAMPQIFNDISVDQLNIRESSISPQLQVYERKFSSKRIHSVHGWNDVEDVNTIELQSFAETQSLGMNVQQTVCRRLSRTVIVDSQSSKTEDETRSASSSPTKSCYNYNNAIPMRFDIYHSGTESPEGDSNSITTSQGTFYDSLQTSPNITQRPNCTIPEIKVEFVSDEALFHI